MRLDDYYSLFYHSFYKYVERLTPPTAEAFPPYSNRIAFVGLRTNCLNPYPTAFPYGNGMVLHFYQQQESSTTKTVHKVINKGLKAYV